MTAELALVLPAVVVVLLVCTTLGLAAVGQLRCADAARAAARAAAIGEPADVVLAVAQDLAGPDAAVTVTRRGEWVEVTVSRPVGAVLPGVEALRASAEARAWVEPGVVP
ncbi:TadE family type IV pilus minor pilin [uncultured Georgenia sp.]|uniref:TadE family type IV pilus minor pilin n=1 Tax=uncultured Georgenia sp. TaxID=378209 RepID=UPI00262F2549|nr:TadE family type IV pilus minor pilin [uncultured Georgenia sp.]HLV04191.1 TadE family type IV pilus minor pilin [Actinomycetaceae bacterium]